MTNYQELKRLAEAAKDWGNCNQAWTNTAEDEAAAVVGHISEDGEKYPVVVVDCDQYYAGGDSIKLAKFYAAANGNVVLSMIAEIDALRTQNQALLEALKTLYVKLTPQVNGADEHCYLIGMRKQVSHAEMIKVVEAIKLAEGKDV